MSKYLSHLMLFCMLAALFAACHAAPTSASTQTARSAAIGVSPTATPLPPTVTPPPPMPPPSTDTPLPATRIPVPSTTPTLDFSNLRGPCFGQTPPGLAPQIFAPGFISLTSSNEYSAAFSPDGAEFYFTRQFTSYQDIYETHLVDGIWSQPAPVPFTAGYGAHEPHITFDNTSLYFGWFRPVPEGEASDMNYGIWAVDRMTDAWSEPRYVGQGMYVSSDQSGQLYVTDLSSSPAKISLVTLDGGRFASFEALNAGAHPWIAPDGSYLVYDRDYGEYLFVRFRLPDGTWGPSKDLTVQGIPRQAGIASISPDGLYLFYTDGRDIYWVSTEIIATLK